MSVTNYNYEKYALAGLRGARSLYNLYNATRPVVGSPLTRVQNQVNILRRTVARQAPQTSNWSKIYSWTTPATVGFQTYDIPITTDFIASSDYTNSVLGDFYRNKFLQLKLDCEPVVPKYRIIVYWSRKAGNTSGVGDFAFTLDPAAFTVIHDSMVFPNQLAGTKFIRLNLRGKMTNYNQSSSTLEYGDLRVRIILYNNAATARNSTIGIRHYIQNK